MKVSSEHLAILRERIAPLDTDSNRDTYRRRDFARAALVKDLDKRYRWDLLWGSGALSFIGDHDYADAHLDTALKAIVRPL